MIRRFALSIFLCTLITSVGSPAIVTAQETETGKIRDGVYELTLKTRDAKKIVLDELVRDRDLNPDSLYRVTTSGYLGFNESDWVEKLEFKVFDIPVTAMPEYRKLANVLADINEKISAIRQALRNYNQLSLRLMKICDKSLFPTLRSMDENISQQLIVYQQLKALRELVANSLDRFVRKRSCVDRFARYDTDLNIYTKRLTNLCKDFDRLRKKALDRSAEVDLSSKEQKSEEKGSSPK